MASSTFEARFADHVARVAGDRQAAGVPLVRGEGQLRREALRLRQRLVVDHDELALVRPAVPLQEDPRPFQRRTSFWHPWKAQSAGFWFQ